MLSGDGYKIRLLHFLESSNSVHIFDIRHNRWHAVANMAGKRCYLGLAFSDGGIFAAGGRVHNYGLLDTVELFIEDSRSWRTVCPMETERWAHATASLDGLIYVSGGVANGYLATVERYDPEDDSWKFVAPMSEDRDSHGMAALKGSLYAIGGSGSSSGERYEPRRDKWYSEGRLTMRQGRHYFGLTDLDDCLYGVGGYAEKKSAERFDPREGHWASIPDMPHTARFQPVSEVVWRRSDVHSDD